MFIVYSPEGQSFIGVPPPKPELRVEQPSAPNSAKSKSDQALLQEGEAKMNHQLKSQLSAYEEVKEAQAQAVKVYVREIMSAPVVTIEADMAIYQAQALMDKSQIHSLPVLNEGQLIGLFTEYDLIGYCLQQAEQSVKDLLTHPVRVCMQKQVITTLPQTEIRRVAGVMSQYDAHALPVMSQEGAVVGMVTRRDLIKRLAELPHLEFFA